MPRRPTMTRADLERLVELMAEQDRPLESAYCKYVLAITEGDKFEPRNFSTGRLHFFSGAMALFSIIQAPDHLAEAQERMEMIDQEFENFSAQLTHYARPN